MAATKPAGSSSKPSGSSADELVGAQHEALDPPIRGGGLLERRRREIDGRPVVRGRQPVPQLHRPDLLEQVRRPTASCRATCSSSRRPVSTQAVVQPEAGEPVARRVRLRLLVLVVREDQVEAAAVDVERRRPDTSSPSPSTRGASPDGPSPHGVSHDGSPGLARFHSAKSSGSRFAGVVGLALLHRARVLAGQRAVRRERPHREVDVAVARRRRGPTRSAVASARSSRARARSRAARRPAAGSRRRRTPRRTAAQLRSPSATTGCPGRGDFEDLVVDVGDVAAADDVEAARHQPAAQHVERDRRADVTDVRRRLHGRAAQIQRDAAGLERLEVANPAGAGVVEAQSHHAKLEAASAPLRPLTPTSADQGGRDRRQTLAATGQARARRWWSPTRDTGAPTAPTAAARPRRAERRSAACCRSAGRRRCRPRSRPPRTSAPSRRSSATPDAPAHCGSSVPNDRAQVAEPGSRQQRVAARVGRRRRRRSGRPGRRRPGQCRPATQSSRPAVERVHVDADADPRQRQRTPVIGAVRAGSPRRRPDRAGRSP